MTGEPDLISLLYRAEWTQLTLSAQVNDGSMLLIAPGRRYRLQAPDYLAGSDGDRPWEVSQDDGAGIQGTVHRIRGPRPPLDQLLCPAQLLKRSRLDVMGHVSVLGRDALRVVVTRRPGTRDGMDASGPIARPPVIRGMAVRRKPATASAPRPVPDRPRLPVGAQPGDDRLRWAALAGLPRQGDRGPGGAR